jgi:hypothetical protein
VIGTRVAYPDRRRVIARGAGRTRTVHAEGRFEDICATLRVVVAALDEAEVP